MFYYFIFKICHFYKSFLLELIILYLLIISC
nr:MAG TPA: hypothetical protein [Inoviridae sp.]